ncbi:MAG: D-alanyl-D-alanine carboxypeptidase [Clostridia bacterium]|nr:D-alanyl-D-alanine carboxypeptidase [Clostridia bacterium]
MHRHYINKAAGISAAILVLILLCSCVSGGPGSSGNPSSVSTQDPGALVITPLPYTPGPDVPGTDNSSGPVNTDAAEAATATPDKTDLSTPSAEPQQDITLRIDSGMLFSRSVILKDIDSGKILYSLSPDKRIYPASLTKIMTGLLTAELLPADRNYEITKESIDFADSRGAATAGFNAGEITNKDALLGGILMSSGAECSYTAAVNISGSEEAFAGLMNQKAQALGLTNTHFVNSTGLHDDDHYTTAEDLLKLTEAALKNPDFVRFFTLDSFKAVTEPERQYQLTLVSTVFSALADYDFGKVKVLGGKTGYTRQAGLCLITYAEYNGHRYVLVTAENEGNKNTERYHFIDAAYIYKILQEEIR